MPLDPVSAGVAVLAVPGVTFLNHILPAERVEEDETTIIAFVKLQQVHERHRATAAWQLKLLLLLPLRQRVECFGIIEGTVCQLLGIFHKRSDGGRDRSYSCGYTWYKGTPLKRFGQRIHDIDVVFTGRGEVAPDPTKPFSTRCAPKAA
jgi:hypothetical protein